MSSCIPNEQSRGKGKKYLTSWGKNPEWYWTQKGKQLLLVDTRWGDYNSLLCTIGEELKQNTLYLLLSFCHNIQYHLWYIIKLRSVRVLLLFSKQLHMCCLFWVCRKWTFLKNSKRVSGQRHTSEAALRKNRVLTSAFHSRSWWVTPCLSWHTWY